MALSHIAALEAESIHILREVWLLNSRVRLCSIRSVRTLP